MRYLDIPDSFFESHGILKQTSIQTIVKYLIDKGVFNDKQDMKIEAFKQLSIILPEWVFDYTRSDTE